MARTSAATGRHLLESLRGLDSTSTSPWGAGRTGVPNDSVGSQASQAGTNSSQNVTRRSTRGSATGTSDDISVAISSSGRMITRGLLSCLQFGPNRHQLLGFVTHVTNLRRPTCLANGTKNGNATFISVQPVTKTSLFSIMKAGFYILVIMMTQKQLNHLWHHIMVPIIHQTVHMVETWPFLYLPRNSMGSDPGTRLGKISIQLRSNERILWNFFPSWKNLLWTLNCYQSNTQQLLI
jgi:hypothetical protein